LVIHPHEGFLSPVRFDVISTVGGWAVDVGIVKVGSRGGIPIVRGKFFGNQRSIGEGFINERIRAVGWWRGRRV